jgi:hypothetical protein
MRARVKGTTGIIEVEFDKDALNACYPPYYDKEHDMYYQPELLEWVDNDANAEPDYWTRLEHQYAGMAMQGLVTRGEVLGATKQEIAIEIADISDIIAHALIQKLMEKEERK